MKRKSFNQASTSKKIAYFSLVFLAAATIAFLILPRGVADNARYFSGFSSLPHHPDAAARLVDGAGAGGAVASALHRFGDLGACASGGLAHRSRAAIRWAGSASCVSWLDDRALPV